MMLKTEFGVGDKVIYQDNIYIVTAVIIRITERKIDYYYQLGNSIHKKVRISGCKRFKLIPVK